MKVIYVPKQSPLLQGTLGHSGAHSDQLESFHWLSVGLESGPSSLPLGWEGALTVWYSAYQSQDPVT